MGQRYFLAPTSQFYFCGIPFRMDVSRQCSFNCKYCFSNLRRGNRVFSSEYYDPLNFRKRIEHPNVSGIVTEWIQKKMPIHLGGMSDPFSTEISTLCIKKILDISSEYSYPIVISTKKPEALLYMNVIQPDLHIIQVSFSVYNHSIAKVLEPYAPSPQERINAILALAKYGYKVIARIQPFIPQFREDVLYDLIPRLIEVKVDHIILEHLKLPIEYESQKDVFSTLHQIGIEYDELFRYGKAFVGREIEITSDAKCESIEIIKNLCNQHHITFGAGDIGFCHFSTTQCCCGIDKYVMFDNWFKGNFSNIIKSSGGILTIDELDKYEYPQSSIGMYVNSHSRLHSAGNTIKDFLIEKWNHPGTINAPDTYWGVSAIEDKDVNGNTIYCKK